MNFSRLPLCVAIAICFAPPLSHAQSISTQELPPITVTATRGSLPLDNAIGDISVLRKFELQAQGSNSIADVLAHQPQVQMYSNGGQQTVTGIFLRGASPQQTRVMLNGIRINNTASGITYWHAIDTAALSQVEIVRGSASSLYGSDAIGGVINLLTYQPGRENGFSSFANVGYGSYNTVKSSVGVLGANNGIDYNLTASHSRSDGFNATNQNSFAYNHDNDGYKQYNVAGSVGYAWAPNQYIGTTFFNGLNRGEFDSGPTTGEDESLSYARQQAYGITSKNQLNHFWTSNLTLGLSKVSFDGRGKFKNAFSQTQDQYSWQNDFAVNNNQTISLVLEHLKERVNNTPPLAVENRYTNAIGLLYRGDFDKNHIQASVRNDHITGYGNEATGSIAYDYDLTHALKIGVAGNSGFRAPSFNDMYYPNDGYFVGNPTLKPESSKNIEAHLNYSSDTLNLGLTAFHTKYRNLINSYDCSGGLLCTSSNSSNATIQGISLAGSYKISNTRISGGIDLLDPKDKTNNKVLPLRAKQVYRVGITHKLYDATFGADYLFTSKVVDYDDFSTNRLGGYGAINLKTTYDFTKSIGIQAYWNNITDKKYHNKYGYENKGSNVFVNLSYKAN